jgi:hypothetical protein
LLLRHTRSLKFYIVLALAAACAHAQLAVVGGQVYNSANDENLNGVTLILTSATNASTPLRFVTENRGLFLFEGLTPGRYLLFAECPGFARQAFGSLGNPLAGMTLTLAPGQQMNDIAFALTPGSSITGKVLDADGAAAVGAVVYALQPIYERGKKEYLPVANAAADDGGEYKLPDLGAGKYLLAATLHNGAATFFPGVTAVATAQEVVVGAAAAETGKDIRLPRASEMRVSGACANCGKAAMAWLTPRSSDIALASRAHVKLEPGGSFEFPAVVPGAYILTATEQDGVTPASAPLSVTVAQHSVEKLVLRPPTTAELSGDVTIAGAGTETPKGTQVVLEPVDSLLPRSAHAPVSAKGTFTFSGLAPGKYILHVLAPQGLYVHSARYHGADVPDAGFDFTGGPGTPLRIMLTAGSAALSGSVRGSDGNAMPGATVALVPVLRRASRYKEVTTDEFGEYRFDSIAPGEYRVYAWENIETGAYRDAAWLKPYEFRGQPFTATPGGHESVPLKVLSLPKE